MSKKELDELITKNYLLIQDKIEQMSRTSNFAVIKNNDCSDVISELYIILSSKKLLGEMRTESDLLGKINNTLNLLLKKSGSSYIREKSVVGSKRNEYTDDNDYENIYSKDDDVDLKEQFQLQQLDYAMSVWQQFGENSDRILMSLYFVDGVNSVSKLARRLKISRYAAHLMITEMNDTIILISEGYGYNEARFLAVSKIKQIQKQRRK